jgi:predicted nucleic acid-binding protein
VIVISDTSVITNLVAIHHLRLLQQLYERILIPEAVYRELADIDPPVPGTLEVQTLDWLEVLSLSDRTIADQLQNQSQLDPGESEAIALALEINAELLLIDERRGRAIATRLGLRITGLLGILVEAKQRSLIPSVKPLMDALIATSEFRVSQLLYEQILQMVNE